MMQSPRNGMIMRPRCTGTRTTSGSANLGDGGHDPIKLLDIGKHVLLGALLERGDGLLKHVGLAGLKVSLPAGFPTGDALDQGLANLLAKLALHHAARACQWRCQEVLYHTASAC